jgi:hypothetical protein
MTETYPPLRRIERDGMIACAVMAAAAWAVARGAVEAPLGVLGGGALALISYRGIKGGIDAVADVGLPAEARSAKVGGWTARRRALGLVKFFTRYAILAVAAYVIMARLRLSPVAVVAGASSVVVAAAVEALRGSQWKS